MDFVESAKSQWTGRYSWGSEVQKTGRSEHHGKQDHYRIRAIPRFEHAHSFAQHRERSAFRLLALLQRDQHRRAFSVNTVAALGIPNLNAGPAGPVGRARRFSAETVSAASATTPTTPTRSPTTPLRWSITCPGSRASTPSNSGSNTIARISTSYGNQFLRGEIRLPAQRHAEPHAKPAAMPSPNFCWATCFNPR